MIFLFVAQQSSCLDVNMICTVGLVLCVVCLDCRFNPLHAASYAYALTPCCYLGISAEKEHESFVNGIEGFDRMALNRTSVDEKNPLPDNASM